MTKEGRRCGPKTERQGAKKQRRKGDAKESSKMFSLYNTLRPPWIGGNTGGKLILARIGVDQRGTARNFSTRWSFSSTPRPGRVVAWAEPGTMGSGSVTTSDS